MLYIVIPVHNRIHFTRACLESLRKQSYQNFKVIVVDDGSTDGTAEMLKSEFPEVVRLEGDGNLWWTASMNLGIEYALKKNCEAVLSLNNDTLHPTNFLEKMVEGSWQYPNTVIGGLELDHESGEIVDGGQRFHGGMNRTVKLTDILSKEEQVGLHEVTQLPGRGCFIPKKVFETIGLFDQKNFPHYLADFDFTYNAMINGFPLMINYNAQLYTYPEESSEVKNKQKKSLKGYYNHLFDITGGANLKDFTRYVLKNSPPQHMPVRFVTGYARRLIGYWVN